MTMLAKWRKENVPFGEICEGSQDEEGNDVAVDRKHESVGALAESRFAEEEVAGIAKLHKG